MKKRKVIEKIKVVPKRIRFKLYKILREFYQESVDNGMQIKTITSLIGKEIEFDADDGLCYNLSTLMYGNDCKIIGGPRQNVYDFLNDMFPELDKHRITKSSDDWLWDNTEERATALDNIIKEEENENN